MYLWGKYGSFDVLSDRYNDEWLCAERTPETRLFLLVSVYASELVAILKEKKVLMTWKL